MDEKEEKPVLPAKLKGVYVPKVERPQHKAMLEYYIKLGKNRSLPKVAKYFAKSVAFMSTLSRAFSWQDRVHQYEIENKDPVVAATSDKVDSTRTKLANFVADIVDTLSELSELSKKVKGSLEGETPEDEKKAKILLQALNVFGVSVSKPRDLKDLMMTLKEIVDFKESTPEPKSNKTSVNVERLLVVSGLDEEIKGERTNEERGNS